MDPKAYYTTLECLVLHPYKLLHDLLGHPHLSKIKKMVLKLARLQALCESCPLGKHIRSFS